MLESDKRKQYCFAHRANDSLAIESILKTGCNGIEIDLIYENNEWLVKHEGDVYTSKISDYILELSRLIGNGDYPQFSVLWLDVKTRVKEISQVATILKDSSNLSDIVFIFDLGDEYGYLSNQYPAFYSLMNMFEDNKLNDYDNMGFGVMAKASQMDEIRKVFARYFITRFMINYGNSTVMPESTIRDIIQKNMSYSPAYRFKKFFTWTTQKASVIEDYMNPTKDYSVEGQIVGNIAPWDKDADNVIIERFKSGVMKFSGSERMGNISSMRFWCRYTTLMGPNKKMYCFMQNQYYRHDFLAKNLDADYPKSIASNWRGLPNDIDAAVSHPDNSNLLFFFKEDMYYRYNWKEDKVDDGYPVQIMTKWPGLPNNIDAVLLDPYQKYLMYFFKGSQYYRFNFIENRVDDGYPKDIQSKWKGIPNKVDGALSKDSNTTLFYKGAVIYEYDWLSKSSSRLSIYSPVFEKCY